MQLVKLSGPSYGPKQGKPDRLIVLIHGYGASGDDLIPLAYSLISLFPSALFVAPHAPFPCDRYAFGRQWYSLTDMDPLRIWAEMEGLASSFNSFLETLSKEHSIPLDKIALVGFSQGAALALHQGLYNLPVGAILGYSGFFVPHIGTPPPHKTPCCLVHGDKDEVVSISFMREAEKSLKYYGIPVETHLCQQLGHGINPHGLEKGGYFLKKHLSSVVKS